MSGGEGIGRRIAVSHLALGALVPLAALGVPLAGAAAARPSVAAPAGAFRLERVLTRELSGGAAIVVTRHWRIAFARNPKGMIVRGEQIFSGVEAPAALAELAGLERARSASEVFPLTLDEAGLIRSSGRTLEGATLVRALETGRALIQSLPLVETGRQDASSYLSQIATLTAGAVSRMPRDLFFPQTGEDITTRQLDLPGGGQGTIEVTARASALPSTGLLVASERRIVTRIEAARRDATERWTLAPF